MNNDDERRDFDRRGSGSDDEEERQRKKRESEKKKPPTTTFGGLPANLDDMNPTTARGPDVARGGFGGVAAMPSTNPFLSGPGFPSAPGFTAPTLGGAFQHQQGFGAKMSPPVAASATAPTTWNVTDATLPTLPPFHPLERTATFVPRSRAETVADRVCAVLQSRSISAEFEEKKAKAKCVSPENVDFRIRLYRGRESYSHGVIVEVQRRSGFSPFYHQDVQAILDGAEGKGKKRMAAVPPPVNLVPDLEAEDTSREPASLSIARKLLKTQHNDATELALNSLLSVTDPTKMGPSVALRASREILAGADDTLRNAVLQQLTQKPPSSGRTAEKEYVTNLRVNALNILANVVTILSKDCNGSALLKSQESFFAGAVAPLVLDELHNAQSNTRMADAAARTLLPLLVTLGGGFAQGLRERGAYETCLVAKDVGATSHASLAEHAGLCVAEIENKW